MADLPQLESCGELPEDECELIAEINEGQAPVVIDPSTKCERMLSLADNAVMVTDGERVWFADGSTLKPIKLDLKSLGTSVPKLLGANSAKEIGIIPAPAGCIPQIMVGRDGSWGIEPFEAPQCWEDICDDLPTQFAGFIVAEDCEGNQVFCIRRFDFSDMIHFASSSCIEFSGTGTEEDPYVFSPIISPDEGNLLECRANGLFVSDHNYNDDPLDEL